MNKYLEEIIRIKLLKIGTEPLEKEDLEKIVEIGINNKTFSDKPKNIDLNDIRMFPNLQILTLQNFQLKDSELELLKEFKDLKTLQLASCEISSNKLHEFEILENLIVSSSNFKDFPKIVLPKSVTIDGIDRIVDLKVLQGVENIEYLRLTNIKKIKNFDIIAKMNNLHSLIIDGSKIDNNKILEEIEKRIEISSKKESLMIR